MRGVGITVQAVVMIFLVVSISFVSQASFVRAEGSGNVCCEETTSGDSCVYTSEDNCAEDSIQASTSCEQTEFCKTGCCISDVGQCSKGVAQATCDSIDGYTWQEGSDCSTVDSCQKNCCVIAESQCSYTTESYCNILIENLEDITLDWRDVDSESSCTDICKASTKGCCVSDDSCVYGTQAECESPNIDISSGYGFYEEAYCSDIGSCGCTAEDSFACVNEDVYSFDRCGNQEGMAEDCDYTAGKWCGTNADGEVTCMSTYCDDTFDGIYYTNKDDPGIVGEGNLRNRHDEGKMGGKRDNGESWCLYESPAGAFKDFPGSQHYRAYCYFGEEIIEPCADYREEVCLQVPYGSYKGLDDNGISYSDLSYEEDYTGPTGSACVDNTDNEVFSPEVTTVSVGNNWDDDSLVETCAAANIDCQQSYAKDSWTDPNFQVGQGVMCTSPQWAKTMNEYCRAQGDCGAAMNLVEEFSNSGFSMSKSQEFLAAFDQNNESYRVYVGYDSCVDHFVGNPGDTGIAGLGYTSYFLDLEKTEFQDQIDTVNRLEQEAIFCLYDCATDKDGSDQTLGECNFISTIDPDLENGTSSLLYSYFGGERGMEKYQMLSAGEDGKIILEKDVPSWSFEEDLGKESYGVYGGLVALSSMFYENVELGDVRSYGWVIGLGIANVLGAVAGASLFAIAVSGVKTGTDVVTFSAAANSLLSNPFGVLGIANSGSGFAAIGNIITIAITIVSAGVIAGIENPLERQKATETFAITSGVSSGLSLLTLIVLVAGTGGPLGIALAAFALAVTAIAALFSLGGEVRDVTISSHCEAWQPPLGSDYCELCDIPVSEGGLAIDDGDQDNPQILTGWDCTQYKCQSLGQSCEYISENAGTTRPKCIAVDVDDVNRPIIEAYMLDVSEDMNDQGVADSDGYVDENAGGSEFSSNDGTTEAGYIKIESEVWPYQYFTFGIETDEPSQCKISQTLPESFDDLDQFFPDSYYDYQHNQSWILVPGTLYNFYIVCQDHNGNGASPPVPFVVQVQTDEGADITPPQIEATSIRNGGYVPAGVNETALSIYLDGPVEGCRWSTIDQEYSLMEWPFICPGVPNSASAYFEDDCSTVLNVTQETNYYYFACIDQDGNYNTENYPFTLVATAPLNIDYVSPSGTLYTDIATLQVQTSSGAESGKAICEYEGIAFFETNSSIHKQNLEDLPTGFYDYDILCQDVAGNQNSTNINFTIDIDLTMPELVSIYKQENSVYFTLDEVASCEYYFEDFSYGSGTDISSLSSSGSFAITEVKEYYLACEDIFGNQGSWIVQV